MTTSIMRYSLGGTKIFKFIRSGAKKCSLSAEVHLMPKTERIKTAEGLRDRNLKKNLMFCYMEGCCYTFNVLGLKSL